MDPRLAELSRSIDAKQLGKRIRSARVAAGLTQGQLAEGEATAAYISRIEDGQRRPKLELLVRLAERMGTTLDALLDTETPTPDALRYEVALDQAELELRGGSGAHALALVEKLATEASVTGVPTDLARRIEILRAEALEATGELSDAIYRFEKLISTPWGSSSWLRCLIALSRCYRDSGDLNRAISVGVEAEDAIKELQLEGMTESIQLTVTMASAYMLRGDLDRAMRLCRAAIEQAEKAKSPIARASAYWNASLIETRKGDDVGALRLAQMALTYFELGEDARNLARLRGHVADMQLEMDPPDARGALETLSLAAQELAWSAGSSLDRAEQLQTKARAHLLLGEMAEAQGALDQAFEMTPPEATVSRAYAYALQGQMRMATADPDSARGEFLRAVQLLTGIGADREAAQLWFELGGLFKAVGDAAAALDAFERAAASTGLRAAGRTGAVTT